MSFDSAKFDDAKFVDNTEDVPVPSLKAFFDDKDAPVFKVRGLEGIEIGHARAAMNMNRPIEKFIETLMAGKPEEKVDALMEEMGIVRNTAPDDYVYRVSCLHQGCVEPSLTESQAVRIATFNGTTFYDLTNKIISLSGMGKKLGE